MAATVAVLLTRANYPDRMIVMRQRLKQYLLIALAAAALYFVLDNHFIMKKHHVYLRQKSTLNLHDTFISLDNKRPATVLKNEELRDAGIGDLMVELGMLTEEKKNQLEAKYTYTE
jgi:hypothetical protein